MHTETVSSQSIFYAPHHNKSLCSENSSEKKQASVCICVCWDLNKIPQLLEKKK